eukprot:gene17738-9406_t
MAADGEVEHGKRDANNRKKSHSNKSKQRPRRNDRNKEETEIEELKEQCSEEIAWQNFSKFDDFPISSKTLNGLIKANFISPTEIQKEGIALALRGLDVLGAAKTGSGKTLAFIIPILELLWKEKFTTLDGLGALVISPTRELAYQTFEVLRKVGKFHSFSAGLIIGGKDMKEEQARILDTNIIVCTPGRLLQHMDETPSFDCNNLKVLVLDEADRILDMGFQDAMNAIIENLPLERQTLLFSATQTKSVKDLARLSLKDPSYVSVHEKAKFITPKKLSQVKFFYEVFRRLRPGVPLMALYGKQKQIKRVGIYEEFCRKASAFLFATDIAARGLDFPEVQWVVQFDCPEDTNTYIHRVGRTARLEKDGQALLILLPSEEAEMIKQLEAKKVPIQEIRPDPKKMQSIQNKLASFCAQSQEMKYWAQRSIVSYARSVFLQSNKKVFDVQKLPIKEYAISLGLPVPPRIRFMKKLEKKIGSAKKEAQKDEKLEKAFKRSRLNDDDSEDSESDDNEERIDEEMETRNEDGKNEASDIDENEEDDVLVLKKKHLYTEVDENEDDEGLLEIKDEKSSKVVKSRKAPDSRVIMAKKIIRKGIRLNTKIKFDEDGEDPSYVSVHEKAKFITPKKLSQVKFFYEVFRRLRPGVPLMALYGKQKQIKRVGIYEEFCRKASAFLFATDIAARGLDFPEVQWVVQFDCPEDTNTYIHRVGRTARLEKDGQALLILLPSEEAEMIKQLEAKKVPIQEIRPDPKKMQSIQNKLASFCAQSQEMKYWAQRSIVSYARSVFLQSNKKVFDVQKLPIKEYAISLGLPVPPRIRFMKKLEKKIGSAKKEAQKDEKLEKAFKRSRLNDDDSEDSESDDNEEHISEEMETRNEDGKNEASDIDENEEDDVLVLKKKHLYTEVDENEDDEGLLEVKDEKSSKVVKSRKAPDSRVIMAKKIIRKGIRLNTKIKFDEDGEANEVAKPVVSDNESSDEVEDSDQLKPISIEELEGKDIVGGIDIKKMMKKLGKEDKLDRQTERDRNSVTLGGEESSNQGELSDGSDEEPEHKRSERPSPRKKARTDTVELPGQQESLKEDEELALQLLSGLS